jgi:hypothetical protein
MNVNVSPMILWAISSNEPTGMTIVAVDGRRATIATLNAREDLKTEIRAFRTVQLSVFAQMKRRSRLRLSKIVRGIRHLLLLDDLGIQRRERNEVALANGTLQDAIAGWTIPKNSLRLRKILLNIENGRKSKCGWIATGILTKKALLATRNTILFLLSRTTSASKKQT